MKQLIIITIAVVFSCCTAGSKHTQESNGSTTSASEMKNDSLPACFSEKIKGFLAEERQNPPRSIYRYKYQGKYVYYITPPCCDFFSELYDADCKLIAQPDGGITGRGDGKAPDFMDTRTEEKLLWVDPRKP